MKIKKGIAIVLVSLCVFGVSSLFVGCNFQFGLGSGSGAYSESLDDGNLDGDGVVDDGSDEGLGDDSNGSANNSDAITGVDPDLEDFSGFGSEGLSFTLSNDGTYYTVSRYSGTLDKLAIPAEYLGVPVTEIHPFAFSEGGSITHLYIPETVAKIGGVENLTLVAFSVSSANPYYKTINGNLYSKDGRTLIRYASGKDETKFVVPQGVVSFSAKVFKDSVLEEIVIPDTLLQTDNSMFLNCNALQFNEFDNAYYLGTERNPYYMLVRAKTAITTCEIHHDTKVLAYYAFMGCEIEEIVVPDQVQVLDQGAFYMCKKLNGITLGKSVKVIGENTFAVCEVLSSVQILGDLEQIKGGAFSRCGSLKRILIPESVTYIQKFAFSQCTALTIYCEAESQPESWDENWNTSQRPVYWGYKGE